MLLPFLTLRPTPERKTESIGWGGVGVVEQGKKLTRHGSEVAECPAGPVLHYGSFVVVHQPQYWLKRPADRLNSWSGKSGYAVRECFQSCRLLPTQPETYPVYHSPLMKFCFTRTTVEKQENNRKQVWQGKKYGHSGTDGSPEQFTSCITGLKVSSSEDLAS